MWDLQLFPEIQYFYDDDINVMIFKIYYGKGTDVAFRESTYLPLREITCHVGTHGDFSAFTPAEAGMRFIDHDSNQR